MISHTGVFSPLFGYYVYAVTLFVVGCALCNLWPFSLKNFLRWIYTPFTVFMLFWVPTDFLSDPRMLSLAFALGFSLPHFDPVILFQIQSFGFSLAGILFYRNIRPRAKEIQHESIRKAKQAGLRPHPPLSALVMVFFAPLIIWGFLAISMDSTYLHDILDLLLGTEVSRSLF